MTTLDTEPLAPLLDRLFAEANTASSPAMTAMQALPAGERMRLLHSKTDYLDLYSRLKEQWLPVSRQAGTLLYMLARSSGARSMVEFGTSFGISALYLAAA